PRHDWWRFLAGATRDRRLYVLLFSGVGAAGYVALRMPLNFFDEGYVLTGAARILAGQAPYRDSWVAYAPGQFFVLALLFKVFGVSLTVERAWDIVLRMAIVVSVYLIGRRSGASQLSFAAGGLAPG